MRGKRCPKRIQVTIELIKANWKNWCNTTDGVSASDDGDGDVDIEEEENGEENSATEEEENYEENCVSIASQAWQCVFDC